MSDDLSKFLPVATRLKTLARAGWRRCGVETCESVADHTFGVALLALLCADASVNRERCIGLALVHDLAEAIVGDLTPHDRVDAEEKRRRERAAIEELAALLGERSLAELWEEFEAGKTPEAALVRDLDVIEMAAQAIEYERAGKLAAAAADGFIDSARSRVRTKTGRQLLEAILRRRA
jgi:putative hydrolase of HD superfamily